MPRESYLEQRCGTAVKRAGGLFWKLTPVGVRGVPDRILILPGGVIWFVELKKPKTGGALEPLQLYWGGRLRRMGCNYLMTNSYHEFCDVILQDRGTLERSKRPSR